MVIINISQPLTVLLLVGLAVLIILLGKEIKKPQVVAVMLIIFLAFVVLHSVQLNQIESQSAEYKTILRCLLVDLAFIFLYFLSYLWIDQLACEKLKKKNLDSSLDWFWKNV